MRAFVAENPQLHRRGEADKEGWIENEEAFKGAAEITEMGVKHSGR
jgi:hypothetical protein